MYYSLAPSILLLGAIEFKLLWMPTGAKSAEVCDLDQLDENVKEEQAQQLLKPPKKRFVNLFEKKRVKGWWPALGFDKDKKEKFLAVSYCWRGETSLNSFYIKLPLIDGY